MTVICTLAKHKLQVDKEMDMPALTNNNAVLPVVVILSYLQNMQQKHPCHPIIQICHDGY